MPPSKSALARRDIEPEIHKAHRILYLHNGSLFERYGGIESYTDGLLSLMGDLYGEKNVYAMLPFRGVGQEAPPKRPFQIEPVQFSESWWKKKWENRFSFNYYRSALDLADHFNPTLLVGSHVALGPLLYALHRATQIPYLTCVHGVEAWGNLWPQDEWCLKHASGILSVSHFTKKMLVDRGYSPHQIKVVHPYLSTALERAKPVAHRPKKVFTLLTVARLDGDEQYKGHDDVLKALFKLRKNKKAGKFKYIIQGDGSDKRRLEGLVQRFGLEDTVQFNPPVTNRAALSKVYKEADIFIMPSLFGHRRRQWKGEGFGIAYLEAAAFGLPSIAYNCGGVTDLVQNGVNGILIEPSNVDSLAEAILKLSKNRKDLKNLGKAAREHALERHSAKVVSSQLLTAFDLY